jgi:archaellum component FlaD/FlaE
METRDALAKLDEETKDNISKLLWMHEFNAEEIPDEIIERLESEKTAMKVLERECSIF